MMGIDARSDDTSILPTRVPYGAASGEPAPWCGVNSLWETNPEARDFQCGINIEKRNRRGLHGGRVEEAELGDWAGSCPRFGGVDLMVRGSSAPLSWEPLTQTQAVGSLCQQRAWPGCWPVSDCGSHTGRVPGCGCARP